MELMAAITGLTNGVKLLQAAASLTVDTAVLTKINDAQGVVSSTLNDLFQAQQRLLEQQKEIQDLHQQIKAHDDWERVRAQYHLVTSSGGATVYKLTVGSAQHYACPVCFANKSVSPLQTTDGGYLFNCPRCEKSSYQIKDPSHRPPPKVETDFDPRDF
jgi:hypothetical protein